MNVDIITRIATAAIRIGVQLVTAGRHREAEDLAERLEAMGPARKADVDAIERDALGRLAPVLTADEMARVGGPLDGGD